MGDSLSTQQQAELLAEHTASGRPDGGIDAQKASAKLLLAGHDPRGQGARQKSLGGVEIELLVEVTQQLAQREGRSVLLSDMGAMLPKEVRTSIKEKGGLRSRIQKYPYLFQVFGMPGKERVRLLSSGPGGEHPAAEGPAAELAPAGRQAQQEQAEEAARQEDEALKHQVENASAVQLRGLPYKASVPIIKEFLGPHVKTLQEERPGRPLPVQLVPNRDGRPSGFAIVQFESPEAAHAARDDLHKKRICTGSDDDTVRERYVEVFLFSERPNKLRFKRVAAPASGEEGGGSEAAGNQEQVHRELVAYMMTPGKGRMLLSMLGVALSPSSRQFLKQTEHGLKHFLEQFPSEFAVEGAKGRECVCYLPVCTPDGQENSDLPDHFGDGLPTASPQGALAAPAAGDSPAGGAVPTIAPRRSRSAGPASGSIADLQRPGTPGRASCGVADLQRPSTPGPAAVPEPPVSPGVPETPEVEDNLHPAATAGTPSFWGTPWESPQPWTTHGGAAAAAAMLQLHAEAAHATAAVAAAERSLVGGRAGAAAGVSDSPPGMLLPEALPPWGRIHGDPGHPTMCWPQAQALRLGLQPPRAPWIVDDDRVNDDPTTMLGMEVPCDNPGGFIGQPGGAEVPCHNRGRFIGQHVGAEGAMNFPRQHRAWDGNEPVRIPTKLDGPKMGPAAVGLRNPAASGAARAVPSHPPGRLGVPPAPGLHGASGGAGGFPSLAGPGDRGFPNSYHHALLGAHGGPSPVYRSSGFSAKSVSPHAGSGCSTRTPPSAEGPPTSLDFSACNGGGSDERTASWEALFNSINLRQDGAQSAVLVPPMRGSGAGKSMTGHLRPSPMRQ